MYDFIIRFPKANADVFIEKWPFYASNMKNVLLDSYKQEMGTLWSEEVEQLLVVLKLLPAKGGSKGGAGILPFIRAIDKLIVHSDVCILCKPL